MQTHTVLIRADASVVIGTGHVLRCLHLAEALMKQNTQVTFATRECVPAVTDRIRKATCDRRDITASIGSAEDAKQTVALATEIGASWIILDGYAFDDTYIRALKHAGLHVLLIDDYGQCKDYASDIVLNQNITAQEAMYRQRGRATRLLLGPAYVLLNPAFLLHGSSHTKTAVPTAILVTMGGADPDNITAKVLRSIALLDRRDLSVTVVLGGANAYTKAVTELAATMPCNVTVLSNIRDMPACMAHNDVAVAAAGTTTYELLFMGIPFVTGAFAENQRAIAAAIGMQKLGINAGWYPDVTEKDIAAHIDTLCTNAALRQEMTQQGHSVVDGKGTARVADALLHF